MMPDGSQLLLVVLLIGAVLWLRDELRAIRRARAHECRVRELRRRRRA